MRIAGLTALSIVIGAVSLPAQEPTYINSIGMELVLIQPGTLLVGRFHPTCPSSAAPSQPAAQASQGDRGRNASGPQGALDGRGL